MTKYLILPTSLYRIAWDVLCMILIFYAMMIIPLRLSFDDGTIHQFQIFDTCDTVSDFIFLTDILLNLNTAIYQKGVLVFNRKTIIIEYIKLWFWLDLFSSFPYELVIGSILNTQSTEQSQQDTNLQNAASVVKQSAKILRILKLFRFVKVLKLLRIAKLKSIFSKLLEHLQFSSVITGLFGFLKLSLIVFFLAHWLACLWHGVGQVNDNHNWMIAIGIYDHPWLDRYISSIYYAVTTMITVGYGDITPKNNDEKLVAILTMMMACGVFGYTMNAIASMISGFDQTTEENKEELKQIDIYMKQKDISLRTQMKVIKYLEYVQTNRTQNLMNEVSLMDQLGEQLQRELRIEINSKVISKYQMLTQVFSSRLIFEISLFLQEQIFSPEEIISSESDFEQDTCLYFLQSGEVEIFFEKTQTSACSLSANKVFGELGFFTDQKTASVKAVDFADIFSLRRKDLLNMLEKYPNDHEKFHEIKDQLILYKNFSVAYIRCYTCGSSDHIVKSCQLLSILGDRQQLTIEYQQYIETRRKNFQRLKKKRFSMKDLALIKSESKRLQEKFFIDDSQGIHENSDNQIKKYINEPQIIEEGQIQEQLVDQLQSQQIQPKINKRISNQIHQNLRSVRELILTEYIKKITEFDKPKNFVKYFPDGNIQNYIEKINNQIDLISSKKKQQ